MSAKITQIPAITNPADPYQVQSFANAVRSALGEMQGSRGDSGGAITEQRLAELGLVERLKDGSIAKKKETQVDELEKIFMAWLQERLLTSTIPANGLFTVTIGALSHATIPTGITVEPDDIPYAMPSTINVGGGPLIKVYFDANDIKVYAAGSFDPADTIRWAVFRP